MNKGITLREACEIIGLSYNTIRKYVSLGIIKTTKLGKSYIISREEIERIQREGVSLSDLNKEVRE